MDHAMINKVESALFARSGHVGWRLFAAFRAQSSGDYLFDLVDGRGGAIRVHVAQEDFLAREPYLDDEQLEVRVVAEIIRRLDALERPACA